MEKETYHYTAELTEIDESYIRGDLSDRVAEELEKRESEAGGSRRSVILYILLGVLVITIFLFIGAVWLFIRDLTGQVSALQERIEEQAAAPTIVVQQIVEKANVDIRVEEQPTVNLKTNIGDKNLTPSEVYAAYSDSVVVIHNNVRDDSTAQQGTVLLATGSGFILSEEGYVVTNFHVIEGADELEVVLSNGDICSAKIVGADSDHDLALLKIEHENLRPVAVGDSSTLVVGEAVCAIGNPLGMLTNTLTSGYISALEREIYIEGTAKNMLQTDCAINEGNSGGPLFDMNGNVIGITAAKYYGTTIEGIGFAIPINDFVKQLPDFILYGYIRGRAYLGVMVSDYLPNGELSDGAYVTEVTEGSCAAIAGLQAKDRIVGLNNVEIGSVYELKNELANYSAGDTVTLTVVRLRSQIELTVVLDEKIPSEAALRNVDE